MDQLKGKVAVVTGAAGSIGRGIATRFARESAKVALVNSDAAQEAVSSNGSKQATGGTAKFIQADVTVEKDAGRAINEAVKAYGRIDVLANSNSAQAPWKPLAEKEATHFTSAINRNLFGALYSMRGAYPHMKQQGGGRIINVGSPYGATTFNNVTDAITADWALQGLTRATAVEWAISNILVNACSPPWSTSPNSGRSGPPTRPTSTACWHRRHSSDWAIRSRISAVLRCSSPPTKPVSSPVIRSMPMAASSSVPLSFPRGEALLKKHLNDPLVVERKIVSKAANESLHLEYTRHGPGTDRQSSHRRRWQSRLWSRHLRLAREGVRVLLTGRNSDPCRPR